MNRQYVLIGVEGNHDQAFISKILCKLLGFSKFDGKISELDPFWRKFIPNYPKGGNLYVRLDMPAILYTETLSVALYAGEGSNLITNLNDKLSASFMCEIIPLQIKLHENLLYLIGQNIKKENEHVLNHYNIEKFVDGKIEDI